MDNEALYKKLEELRTIESDMVSTYGVADPYSLVSKIFQKKYRSAKQKFNISLSFDEPQKQIEMCDMMIRANKALQKQLEQEAVVPIPIDTWIVKHRATNTDVLVCKHKEQIQKVKKDMGRDIPIFSVEELLDCIPADIFEFRNMLDAKVNQAAITSIRDIDES